MNKYAFWIIAVVLAVASFALSRVIWPDLPEMIAPSSAQLPFFIFLSVLESVSFGVGVAFLATKWGAFMERFGGGAFSTLTFLAMSWLMISWWPHDNLHRTTAEGNYWGLLRIEYGFHLTLMLAGFIIALFVVKRLLQSPSSAH